MRCGSGSFRSGCSASLSSACVRLRLSALFTHLFACLRVWLQASERSGSRPEGDERRKQNGGSYEEESTAKQHRKPERTLRYETSQVRTVSHKLVMNDFSRQAEKYNKYK